MKKIFFILGIVLIIVSCSKKDVKFETFSPEAFAYDVGDGISEVNAIVRIKGFTQNEKDGNYTSSISFDVDLIKPDGSTVKSIFKDVHKESESEAINDVGLEAQFNLDSTYAKGDYKIIFNIKDDLSDNATIAEVGFNLSD